MTSSLASASHAEILGHIRELQESMTFTGEEHGGFSDSDESGADDVIQTGDNQGNASEHKDKSGFVIDNRSQVQTRECTDVNRESDTFNKTSNHLKASSRSNIHQIQKDHKHINGYNQGYRHSHAKNHLNGVNSHGIHHNKSTDSNHVHCHVDRKLSHHRNYNHHYRSNHNHHADNHHPSKETKEHNGTNDDSETAKYTILELRPIMDGQRREDADKPILEVEPVPRPASSVSRSSYYARPMSLQFLVSGDKIDCTFYTTPSESKNKDLLDLSEKDTGACCHCPTHGPDDVFSGWAGPSKHGKAKGYRKKRPPLRHASSELAFSRLTQGTGKDPVIFHHYKDQGKYMERYRFFHTVGNVARPHTSQLETAAIDTDPYLSKVKTNIRSAQYLYNIMCNPFIWVWVGVGVQSILISID